MLVRGLPASMNRPWPNRIQIQVHIDHPSILRAALRDLVDVPHRRESRPDVEELPDTGLGGELYRPTQECPVEAYNGNRTATQGLVDLLEEGRASMRNTAAAMELTATDVKQVTVPLPPHFG